MSGGRKSNRAPNGENNRRHDEKFIQDVLSRTSGSPCERAAGLLPALTDDALEDMDRRLVQAHLEHCPGCRTLAVTLGWLDPLLPKMAFLDPGPEFTQKVLSRTSLAAPGLSAGPVTEPTAFGPAGVMDRLGRWWQRQILRPVFPMQVAYAATVVIVLLVATPVSPFRQAPGRLLQTVQAGPESLPIVGSLLDSTTHGTSIWVQGQVDYVSQTIRDETTGAWRGAESDLTARMERTNSERGSMKSHLGDLVRNLKGGNLGDAGYDLHRVLKSGRRAWALWWNSESIAESNLESTIERRTP
ncbi:MAG: zf-HC2 domain-containing protein [Gemmatimonadales bacterium]|nr:zf-HC2 domain-containing protein [Gemmatimonadales bacterium]